MVYWFADTFGSPRVMFWAQVIATAVAGTVQLGVQSWIFTNIPDICSANQKDGFTVGVTVPEMIPELTTVCSVLRRKSLVRLPLSGESSDPRDNSRMVRSISERPRSHPSIRANRLFQRSRIFLHSRRRLSASIICHLAQVAQLYLQICQLPCHL